MRQFLIAALALLAGRAVQAGPALRPFPAEVLRGYAATLVSSEIAVIETDPAGQARQITLLGYAKAPPALVRDLVADPTKYPRYVRNLSRSEVERRPDGALINRWRLSFPIGSFEGADEVRPLPPRGGGPGPVALRSLGPGKEGTFLWEFLPVAGGGTLVVHYGRYDRLDNRILRAMIGRDPALDAGFNLAGGLSLLRALLQQAAREGAGAAITPPGPPMPNAPPDFGPLLARGTLAVVRTDPQSGRLIDVSVVARVGVAHDRLLGMVRAPELWPHLMGAIRGVRVTRREPGLIDYEMTVRGLLFDVVTDYRLLLVAGGADTLAMGGALKGARFRWDLRPDGPGATVVVWRGNVHLGDASRIVRAMFRMEPSFEHSANVSIGLVCVRSLAAYAAVR
jgi:hypothetical protein